MTGDRDPLLAALLERLPGSDVTWPLPERALWLRAFEAAVHLVYKPANLPKAEVEHPNARVRELIEAHGTWVLAELGKERAGSLLEASK